MRKEIIKCDLCGVEIKSENVFYYTLIRKGLTLIGRYDGPDQMDICRHCIQNLLDPLGKWEELEQDEEATEAVPIEEEK